MISQLLDRLCGLLSGLMVAALALMVVMVFGNVVLRYGFNTGITISEELSRWLFVWMTFMGALVALRKHGHLGTDSLVSRLPIWGKKLCLGITHLLMISLCWLMLQGALAQTKINMGTTSAVMEASMAWFYASGVVFAVLAALILAHELWKMFAGQLSEGELVGVRESEDDPAPHGQATPHATKEQA